jgi:hypothetical protein
MAKDMEDQAWVSLQRPGSLPPELIAFIGHEVEPAELRRTPLSVRLVSSRRRKG